MTLVRRLSVAAVVLLVLSSAMSAHTGSAAGLTVTSQAITLSHVHDHRHTDLDHCGHRRRRPAGDADHQLRHVHDEQRLECRRGEPAAVPPVRLTQCSPTIPLAATIRLATLRHYSERRTRRRLPNDRHLQVERDLDRGRDHLEQPALRDDPEQPCVGHPTGSFNVGTPAGCQNQTAGYVVGATVTSDVAAFVSGTTNFGWMLRDDVEASATTRTSTFSGKDLGTLAQAPQLVITYTTP